jgi:hypothetical protein
MDKLPEWPISPLDGPTSSLFRSVSPSEWTDYIVAQRDYWEARCRLAVETLKRAAVDDAASDISAKCKAP